MTLNLLLRQYHSSLKINSEVIQISSQDSLAIRQTIYYFISPQHYVVHTNITKVLP